jgi:hypothetical protein
MEHTGYGLIGDEIPMGFLYSTRGKKEVPNPCEHLDNKGVLLHLRGDDNAPRLSCTKNVTFNGVTHGFTSQSGEIEVVRSEGYVSPKKSFYTYDYWGDDLKALIIELYYPISSIWNSLGTLPPGDSKVTYTDGMPVYMPYSATYPMSTHWQFYQHRFALRSLNRITASGHYGVYMTTSTALATDDQVYEGSYELTHMRCTSKGVYEARYELTETYTTTVVDAYGRVTTHTEKNSETFIGFVLPMYPPGALHSKWIKPKKSQITLIEDKLFDYWGTSKYCFDPEHATTARTNALTDADELDSNYLENASGLKGSFSVINDLRGAGQKCASGDIYGALRDLAGVYLWYQYACAPTIRDVKDVTKNTERLIGQISKHRFSNERRRGMFSAEPNYFDAELYYCTYHLRLQDKVYATLWNALEKFGLQVDAASLWELVPYSFVVDWFISIGPTLEILTAYNSMRVTKDIVHRIETFKTVKIVTELEGLDPTQLSFLGPYEQSYYHRKILSGPGEFHPFKVKLATGASASQWTQGGALLIQQMN